MNDVGKQTVHMIDLNGNYLGSHGSESFISGPGPLCACENSEVFIGDYVNEKIYVFDADLTYLREFGDHRIETPLNMCVDSDTKYIYISAYFSDIITIWNHKSGEYISEISLNSPTFMNICKHKLYVMSAIESECFTFDNSKIESNSKQNAIYIFNKLTHELLGKIKLVNCIYPKGLQIDDDMNIYFTGFDSLSTSYESFIDKNTVKQSGGKCLFKFNEDGVCTQKTNLSINGIIHMAFADKKILFTCGFRMPSLYLIEFR